MRMIAKAGALILLLGCHALSQSDSETTGASTQRNFASTVLSLTGHQAPFPAEVVALK
jgi:hypothetical protein